MPCGTDWIPDRSRAIPFSQRQGWTESDAMPCFAGPGSLRMSTVEALTSVSALSLSFYLLPYPPNA
jgi:hypothetical protein